jgi:hypothetical protein
MPGWCAVWASLCSDCSAGRRSEASGFCYVNDIVLAILELLKCLIVLFEVVECIEVTVALQISSACFVY